MRLLVDTFNVLHVTGVLPPGLAGPDVAGLAALLVTSRWREAHVALVCDGSPPTGSPPRLPARIRAIYSQKAEADEVLEQLITDSSAPNQLLVVSSDRRVRRAARRRGAKDLDAVSFLRMLLEDRREGRGQHPEAHRPATLRPGEVETWRSEFQLEDEPIKVTDEDLPHHLRPSREPPTPPPHPAPEDPGCKSDQAPDPASLLPPELIEEARQLLGCGEPPPPPVAMPEVRRTPGPSAPSPAPDGPIPEDIIREAEDMLSDDPPRE